MPISIIIEVFAERHFIDVIFILLNYENGLQ